MLPFVPLLHRESVREIIMLQMLAPAYITISMMEATARITELILWGPHILAGPGTR